MLPNAFNMANPFAASFEVSTLFSPFAEDAVFFTHVVIPVPVRATFLNASSFFSGGHLFTSVILSIESVSPIAFMGSSTNSLGPVYPLRPDPDD